jgi:hypothetical protein
MIRFDALIPRVRNAIVDVTIEDKIGANLWKHNYIGQVMLHLLLCLLICFVGFSLVLILTFVA